LLLESIKENPYSAWLYLERYVNKGSPSGYTRKYHPPGEFDPQSNSEYFILSQYSIASSELITYGQIPNCLEVNCDENLSFFMHPIMTLYKDFFSWIGLQPNELSTYACFHASPTASGRTVWLHKDQPIHLKFHYPGVLGRVNRELPFHKAIAGPELWFSIKPFLDTGKAPKTLSFLPEIAARIWYPPRGNIKSIGVIVRDARPYPNKSKRCLIPFFALFSQDLKAPKDRLLIFQILDNANNPANMLFEYILKPLIESYTYLTFDLGILPEINAQNILLELSLDFLPTRIVLRDISRTEKNLDLRRKIGLQTNFKSGSYKTIDASINRELSEIRHSFSFDFKLSTYVIGELIDCCAKEYQFKPKYLDELVRELFEELGKYNISHYFPHGNVWYSHDKILLTNKRPYIQNKNPRFRRRIE